MAQVKKLGIFLLILLLLGSGTVLAAWELVSECVSALRTGLGDRTYSLVAAGDDRSVYALGQDEKGYFLTQGNERGQRTGDWRLESSSLPRESVPVSLYVNQEGLYFLSLFDTSRDPAELEIYRFADGKGERLLTAAGEGSSLQAQMNSVHTTDFYAGDANNLYFGVCKGNNVRFYAVGAEGGVEQLSSVNHTGLRGAAIWSEENWVVATEDEIIWKDRDPIPVSGQIIENMTASFSGLYYLEGTRSLLCCAGFFDWSPYAYLNLAQDNAGYDLDSCTHLAIGRSGSTLLLMDGKRLLLDRGEGVDDLTGILRQPDWQCGLILGGLAAGVLLASLALWYIVCEVRRLRIPLLVRWGVLMAAAAFLMVAGMARLAAPASIRAAAKREAQEMLSATARLAMAEDLSDADLPQRIGASLSQAEGGTYRDVRAAVFEKSGDGAWYLVSDSAGGAAGLRAELCPGFDEALVRQAVKTGSSFGSVGAGDAPRFVCCLARGGRVLAMDVSGSALLLHSRNTVFWTIRGLAALAVLLTALSLAVLCRITLGLRKVMDGMEALTAGERDISVSQGGGDELTSMAEDLNALSRAIGAMEERHREMERAYRRFVPERVLSLLGKQSIAQVDKHTFVTRHLAAMTLSFRFPEEVYSSGGRELFDNVNEIIERTASIVTGKGGTVFNFAYTGYDAVFEGGSAGAVSTAVAVQQEILEINAQREAEGRPGVSARIALDEGNVILGVVGDENQIEPTSISTSLSTARHLLELCGRLEAHILCTEAVISGAEGYASRYVGKCAAGDTLIRTYEIFDGDPYEIRKFKDQTRERFAEGIYALYGRDFSRAKGIFLSLVHRSTSDGGARYYLYLADQMEKRPEEDPNLDFAL